MTRHPHWNIYDIRNPWLRLPVAWVTCSVLTPVVVLLILLVAIQSAAIEAWRVLKIECCPEDIKVWFAALTDTSRSKP